MLPSRHVVVSLTLGTAVALFTESLFAGILCFGAGVFIDIDHLLDYSIHYGLKGFSLERLYRACLNMANRKEAGGMHKVYLIFHAIEIAILLWVGFVLTKNIYLLALALGYSGHIIMDASANKLGLGAYFISWRMKNGFDATKYIGHYIDFQ